jgi:hypothetical protein
MHRSCALLVGLLALPAAARAGDQDHLTPLVQLQLWGTAFDQDEASQADSAGYGDPEHDIGLSVRRARVGFEGRRGPLDFLLDLGLSAPYDAVEAVGTSTPRLGFANAFARGSWALGPGVGRVAFGLVRVPFNRERLMSSRELTFQERSVGAAWIAPAQDLGVLLDYELHAGPRLQLGVYNGGGDLFGDDNPGVMLAGRLEYARGDTYRTYGQADGVDIGAAVAGFWNDDLATDTFGVEGDVLVRVWRLSVLGEVDVALLQPGNGAVDLPEVLDPTRRLGVTAQLSYWHPIGDDAEDVATQSAVELAARLGTFDDNTGLSDNGDVAIVHVGATWRNPTPGLDLGLGLVHREELGGRPLPNDTVRLWVQLRWPARGVATTATSPPAVDVDGPDIPTGDQVHPDGPK